MVCAGKRLKKHRENGRQNACFERPQLLRTAPVRTPVADPGGSKRQAADPTSRAMRCGKVLPTT